MPGQRAQGKSYLGWWVPAEVGKWVETEADRREVSKSHILTEALSEYRASRTTTTDEGQQQ
jgi:hypothetical protein